MKTHINQIFTVVGFFSMSIVSTLTISWGMNSLLEHNKNSSHELTKIVILKQDNVNSDANLMKSFRFLIPKVR